MKAIEPDEYLVIVERIKKATIRHHIQKSDVDDIIHDICLHILDEDTPEDDYGFVISKYIGKFREQRDRERKRNVSLPEET